MNNNQVMLRKRNMSATMGSLPREGEIETWKSVIASRANPIPKEKFWGTSKAKRH